MSGTADTFDNPAGNYPDRGGEHPNADGTGPDEGGEWSGPVSEPARPGVQTEPAEAMHETTTADQVAGVIEQTKADAAIQDLDDAAGLTKLLQRRLDDAGLTLPADEVDTIVERIRGQGA